MNGDPLVAHAVPHTTASPPSTASSGAPSDAPRSDGKRKRDFRPIWLVGPSMVLLAIVIGYPILRAIYLSFQANKHLDPETGMFVTGGFAGLDNYLYWLSNRCMSPSGNTVTCAPGQLATDFWPALKITIFFVVVTVTLETILGLWMALVMNRSFLGRGLLRAAVLVPWAIPTAVTAKLWQFIFANQGIVNSIMGTQIHWTTDPWAARFAVIIADVWKTAPFMALLILAGLQMVPQGVYEAARVDGASKWQQFTQITLPLIKPALMVAILFRTLDALRMYDLPVIMISESSNSPTAVISQLVIQDTKQGNFNSASAMSTLIFLLIFAVAFVMVKFLGADVGGSQGGSAGGKRRASWWKKTKAQPVEPQQETATRNSGGGAQASPALSNPANPAHNNPANPDQTNSEEASR